MNRGRTSRIVFWSLLAGLVTFTSPQAHADPVNVSYSISMHSDTVTWCDSCIQEINIQLTPYSDIPDKHVKIKWYRESDALGMGLIAVDPASTTGSPIISEEIVELNELGSATIYLRGPMDGSLNNTTLVFRAELVSDPTIVGEFLQRFTADDAGPQISVDTTAFGATVNIKTSPGARPEQWTVTLQNDYPNWNEPNDCDPDASKTLRVYAPDGSLSSNGPSLNHDPGSIIWWTGIMPGSDGDLPTRFVIPGLQPSCTYEVTIHEYRGQQEFSDSSGRSTVGFQTKASDYFYFESAYPSVGPSGGGTSIKLRGAGFMDALGQSRVSTVAIGPIEVPFTVLNETEISAVTPAGDVGPVNIIISYVDQNAVVGPGAFHYIDPAISGSCSNGKVAQWNFNDTSTVESLGSSSCGNLDLQRSGNYGTLPVHGIGMNGSAGVQLSNAAFLGISPYNSDSPDPAIVPSSLLGLAHYSISAWFQKPASSWGNDGILSWGTTSPGSTVNLRLQNPGYGGTICTYWWNWDMCNGDINPPQMHDGNWHNLVTTFNGSERRTYLDGTLVANDFPLSTSGGCQVCSQQGITPYFQPGFFAIGITAGDITFSGNLDNISVYNRAITPNEIRQEVASNMYKSTQYLGTVGTGISISPILDFASLGVVATLAPGSTLPAGLTLSTSGVLSGTPSSAGSSASNIVLTDSMSRQTQVTIRINIAQQSGYRVGDTGPGGGTVVYASNSATDGTFFCGPSLAFTCNAIEVAPRSWYQSLDGAYNVDKDPTMTFSNSENFNNYVGQHNCCDASSTVLGAGLSMTLAVVSQNGLFNPITNVYAAGAAQAYQGGGLNDWYLMNQPESQILAQYPTGDSATGIPAELALEDSFNDINQPGGYWNSNSANAWFTGFAKYTLYFNPPSPSMNLNGYADGNRNKDEIFFVRPIRAFYALSQPLVITSPSNSSVIDGTVGVALNTSISATGGLGALTTTISAGTAPSWFHLATNGAITGTPDTASDFTLSFTVTDAQSNSSTVTGIRFRITAPVNRPSITSPTTGSRITGMRGTPLNSAVLFTGGTAPETVTVTSGTLPTGLTLAPNGTISGTPTTLGQSTLGFKVTDSNNETATVTNIQFVIYDNFGAITDRANAITDSMNNRIDQIQAMYNQAESLSGTLTNLQISQLTSDVQAIKTLIQGDVLEVNNGLSYIATSLSGLDAENTRAALEARGSFNAAIAAATTANAEANRTLALLTRLANPTPTSPTPAPVITKDPDQTSSITSISQGCPTDANTVVIKGSFAATIANITINNRMIDKSQWKQSSTQVIITIPNSTSTTLEIQIFNGQVPVLPAQTITLSSACPTPTPTPTATPTPAASPTPTPSASPTPTPTPSASPTPTKMPALKTLTCMRGKTVKTVKGTNPKCPKGYTIKKK